MKTNLISEKKSINSSFYLLINWIQGWNWLIAPRELFSRRFELFVGSIIFFGTRVHRPAPVKWSKQSFVSFLHSATKFRDLFVVFFLGGGGKRSGKRSEIRKKINESWMILKWEKTLILWWRWMTRAFWH